MASGVRDDKAADNEKLLRKVSFEKVTNTFDASQTADGDLRQQSDWLRITLASIGDGVISTDADGRLTFMNRVAEELTGWPRADAVGRPLAEVFRIIDEHSREPLENPAVAALRDGKTVELGNHNLLVGRDGAERPIDDTAAPMRDASGTVLGAVLVFRNVTERKRAERSRKLLASIVQSSDDAIVSKTLDGIIQSWNSGAQRLFGYTAEEAIGQSITLIIPRNRRDEEVDILERLRRGERIDHFETVRVAKDGRLIDISLTISPLFDEDGHIIGASKVARDITERTRADAILRESDRRKDEYLALLAHELRNPLAPLRNGLQVLRLAPGDDGSVEQVRGMMERQLDHMVRLVDDLLDVARISQNKIELKRTHVPLAAVINSAIETARPAIDAERHELNVSLPADALFVDADLTRLAQVFSNLLTNSAKYTPAGGRISITAERDGREVVVVVRDTGIGIPADALPRIFEMFSQVDRGIERQTGGLGMGLALVRGLVELHSGTVRAESDGAGKGSTFTVRLPAANAEIGPPTLVSPWDESAPSTGGRRILVVDDNRDSAYSLAKVLKLLGNEVETADDGARAVAAAEAFAPDVILMDVGMPGQNGYDSTRQIRQQPWGRRTVIIALTGWGQTGDRIQSREAGCDGHLVKPVNLQDLQKMMGELAGAAPPMPRAPTAV
jgi:PAS domain S-box-containing protein